MTCTTRTPGVAPPSSPPVHSIPGTRRPDRSLPATVTSAPRPLGLSTGQHGCHAGGGKKFMDRSRSARVCVSEGSGRLSAKETAYALPDPSRVHHHRAAGHHRRHRGADGAAVSGPWRGAAHGPADPLDGASEADRRVDEDLLGREPRLHRAQPVRLLGQRLPRKGPLGDPDEPHPGGTRARGHVGGHPLDGQRAGADRRGRGRAGAGPRLRLRLARRCLHRLGRAGP